MFDDEDLNGGVTEPVPMGRGCWRTYDGTDG
ncbi:MAG: hypothetical protein QG656_1003, partial [Candidatus Hydrogenedentes bacterium]|nr:hypothetical protein [Candidatus Hydrogenedentota bacterium]